MEGVGIGYRSFDVSWQKQRVSKLSMANVWVIVNVRAPCPPINSSCQSIIRGDLPTVASGPYTDPQML